MQRVICWFSCGAASAIAAKIAIDTLFKLRCEQSRELGVRLVEISHHKRIFLDELPDKIYRKIKKKEVMSCGPDCGANQQTK